MRAAPPLALTMSLIAAIASGLLLASEPLPTAKPAVAWNPDTGRALLTTGSLELTIETKQGINARSLRNTRTGCVYADRDYCWPGDKFPKLTSPPAIVERQNGTRTVTLKGRLGPLSIEQTFTAPADQPGVILENIAVRNRGKQTAETATFKCGFAKHVRDAERWSDDATQTAFSPVPYRRETNGSMQVFPLREVAEHGVTYAGWESPIKTPVWGAEGWVLTHEDDTLLLAKFNRDSMEWSLMEPVKRGDETVVRFGGAGQWKHGHPEGSTRLAPGAAYRFGQTRIQAVDGDWKQAYYAYRSWVDGKGCMRPSDYDPPVHWNELYDNDYYPKVCELLGPYVAPDGPGFCPEFYAKNKDALAKYYSLDLMKAEAAKAKELGCEALYMDPGWDDGLNTQRWDAARLGPLDEFVKIVKRDYGLKTVSLWCSLGGVPPTIGDPSADPPEARLIDKDGKPGRFLVCFASPAFLDTKTERLLELCKNGAGFFMFDSDQYSGPCCDKRHGHSIPATREEHAKALFELARRVKTKYPHVLIELHDPVSGPSNNHYTPTYFGYAPPYSFDCLWGHEFMWNSMDDLLSRRAVSLYYYNLAYDIPLYLHVSLKPDNENAIVFWWFASTCRHLGMGGKSPNPAVWNAQKKAMQAYLPLKRFYTQGTFYGIDEMTHAHTLPDLRQSVVNVFNLEDKPVERRIRFRPGEIGLPAGSVEVEGAESHEEGDSVELKLTIPARGHALLKVRSAAHSP